MMPEPRPPSVPAKFLPRARQSLRITFAPPIDTRHIASVLASANPSDSSLQLHPSPIPNTKTNPIGEDQRVFEPISTKVDKDEQGSGDMREPLAVSGLDYGAYGETPAKRWVRSALTAAIQREVEKVGYAVEGPLLGRPVSHRLD